MDVLKLTRLTKLEMEILDKYVQVMNPIAQALDKLQGEGDCFLVNLIPTIHQTYKHLLHVSGCVNHTKQLAVGLSDAVKSRFAYLFTYNADSAVYAAASVCHPKFKLRWLPEDKRQWAKDIFLEAAISYANTKPTSAIPADGGVTSSAVKDNFF